MKNKIFSLALMMITVLSCNTIKNTGETTGKNFKRISK